MTYKGLIDFTHVNNNKQQYSNICIICGFNVFFLISLHTIYTNASSRNASFFKHKV